MDKNKPEFKNLPKIKGLQVEKILKVYIGEKETSYHCIMEDGTLQFVPEKEFIKINKKE